jgi:hypothetical protein
LAVRVANQDVLREAMYSFIIARKQTENDALLTVTTVHFHA